MALPLILGTQQIISQARQGLEKDSRCPTYSMHALFVISYLYTIIQAARSYIVTGSQSDVISFAVYLIPLGGAHFLVNRYGNITKVLKTYEKAILQAVDEENKLEHVIQETKPAIVDLKSSIGGLNAQYDAVLQELRKTTANASQNDNVVQECLSLVIEIGDLLEENKDESHK